MGINFQLESTRAVTITYLRIASFSFNASNSLTIRMDGYINADAYLSGADPIDSFDVTYHNYDSSIKAQFYDLIEDLEFFEGAEKEVLDPRQQAGQRIVTITAVPSGRLLLREVLEQPQPPVSFEPVKPLLFEPAGFSGLSIENKIGKE